MPKRRAQGDGTVYYDSGRARWVGAITIGGRRRKVTGKDRTEATTRLRNLIREGGDGRVDDRSYTLSRALDAFMESVPSRTRRAEPIAPATVAIYRWSADIIAADLGRVRLVNLTVEDVEAMLKRLATRKTDPLSAASLRKVRGTLLRAVDHAVVRGKVTRNVVVHARIPDKATRTNKRNALSPDDARRLLEVLHDHRNGAVFALGLCVGLRPGEAAGLHWDDLDLDGRVLHVRRGVRRVGSKVEVVEALKTDASTRSIELPAGLAGWLAEHRAIQVRERLAAPAWRDARLVFASPTGNVLNPSNVRRHLAEICAAAGVPITRPNELRHSCASLLSDIGVPNEQIADLLGHTTTRMVEATYRHRLRPVVDVAASADWTKAL